jgi:hypothetical protein
MVNNIAAGNPTLPALIALLIVTIVSEIHITSNDCIAIDTSANV